ncbi:CgeB family protein [Paenibacillus eucommiae]|uniref:Spore maturation protein CgeB n=1 Tax=Paenibacillus eucommiae TaxID=1355755 RepID=A0ABS4INN5_9BACL|nr:glycosyltransferase [Paenibacillus eucommiae]MBP1989184.1 spore maturation protein CgeB [Paenibacillus eucommiae]
MRILFLERGKLWSYGLPDGFRELGHMVRMSGPVTSSNVAKHLNVFKPDLLISVGWGPDHTRPKQQLVRKLATQYKIPLVYWSTEDPNFTQAFTIPLLQTMNPDFVFTISSKTAARFRKMGYRSAHLDFAYHRNVHQSTKPIAKYRSDIAVVANAYPDVLRKYPLLFRRKALEILIRPLLKHGLRIDFYGRDWHRMAPFLGAAIPKKWLHGPIAYKDAHKVYSSAKIILGLQNYKDMVTQRTYEVLGSRGFMLTCDTPAIHRLLKPGREIAVSSTPQQTVLKVRYYLENQQAREEIQKQGRKAIDPHHYKNRAQTMLSTLHKQGLFIKAKGGRL